MPNPQKFSYAASNLARKLISQHFVPGLSKAEAQRIGRPVIRSIGTRQAYVYHLTKYIEWMRDNIGTDFRDAPPDAPETYLKWLQANNQSQSVLDGRRQCLQLVVGRAIKPLTASSPEFLAERAYSTTAIDSLIIHAQARLVLPILLSALSGARATGVLTIARQNEQPASNRPWHPRRFVGRENCVRYTVKEKGGLTREISVPNRLAELLESKRLSQPRVVRDRSKNWLQRYDLLGGQRLSQCFGEESQRILGYSHGFHGIRHSFAIARLKTLQHCGADHAEASSILATELGHFDAKVTLAYYDRNVYVLTSGRRLSKQEMVAYAKAKEAKLRVALTTPAN